MEEIKEVQPLGVELRWTARMIMAYINTTMEKELDQDLTGVEGMILGFIFRNQDRPLTSRDVIAHYRFSKAAVSETLHGLCQKGFIRMDVSPQDKRSKIIQLTPKGEKTHASFKVLFAKINDVIEKGLSEDDKKQIRQYLSIIRSNTAVPEDSQPVYPTDLGRIYEIHRKA